MIETILAATALLFALGPAWVYSRNVRLFRSPERPNGTLPAVSILIPARNEARSLPSSLAAAITTRGVDFEVVVLDDHSEDDTAAITRRFVDQDARVRLEQAPELPAGWCGKQHACFALARLAQNPILCFIDADVQVTPDGVARMTHFLQTSQASLVSGFPLQLTDTFLERLLIPLIHFLLLGYLPFRQMRLRRDPRFGAGCGQLFVIRRDDYEKCGGHQLVKSSLHDGITLPRAFRAHGMTTDLCDATTLAVCRMYRSGREVWSGLAKNAREGLAAPRLIVPATIMLLLGQVLPLFLFLFLLSKFAILVYFGAADFAAKITSYQQSGLGLSMGMATLALFAGYYPRVDAAVRFHQPFESAFLHPFGILVLLAIQWYAAFKALLKRPSSWKGRTYAPS